MVFHSDEKNDDMIKRLIGLPGDKVVIKDGIVTVNGETLKENYIGTADNYSGEFERHVFLAKAFFFIFISFLCCAIQIPIFVVYIH